MKTKEEVKKSRNLSPGLLLSPPSPPQERAVDDLGLQRIEIEGTKRECL